MEEEKQNLEALVTAYSLTTDVVSMALNYPVPQALIDDLIKDLMQIPEKYFEEKDYEEI